MPSPFPGMNPYLEQADTWEDFHSNFITHAQKALADVVGPNYVVKIEVRLYLHELSAEERRFFGKSDLGVLPTAGQSATGRMGRRSAPVQLQMPAVEVERHSSLEIRDGRNRRVVTAIELLSPTNKNLGPDRDDYLRKRMELFARRVNFVEIDLRRGGHRPRPPELPPCDYYALVARPDDWPHVDMWPIGLRDPLPVIPIPLTPPDADVTLDLQGVLNSVYDDADYGKYIYTETPEPPLSRDEAAWARQFLPSKK
jgi:hypothetical protein